MSLSHPRSVSAAIVLLLMMSAAFILVAQDTGASYSESSGYPGGSVTITTNDTSGEITQTFTEVPERVIVGNVTCLEMMLYFGLGDRIVGIYYLEDEVWSELDNEFADVIERLNPEYVCTGLMTQAVATSLEPDLIIGYMSSFGESNWSIGTTQYWNEQGCNVWSLNSQAGETNVDGMKKDYGNLGQIFQIQDVTDKYISDFDQASDSVSTHIPVNAAIFEYSKDETSYTNYGDSSFIGDALVHCNGVNIFGDLKSVDKATLISSTQLQAIVVVAFGDYTPEQAVSDILADSTLQDLPAIKNRNVIGIGLSQTYGGVQALSVMQSISELLNHASEISDAGEDLSNSDNNTLLYVALTIIAVVIILVVIFLIRGRNN